MIEGRYFIVKKATHSEQKTPCVFSVSKKIFKTAVERNKIKRQMRSILKKHKRKNEYNFIVPKKEIIGKSFKDIESDLVILLEK